MTCTCGTCNGSIEANSGCNDENCCTQSSSTCCNTANTTGVPYYSCVNTCPEDNTRCVTINKTAGVFKTCKSFVMPACSGVVSVTFESITSLPIGGWMWAAEAGTFEITGYDTETGIVQLKNLCPESPCANAASPGASIPNCTVFVLSMPGCNESTFNPNAPYPYLAADFVAPANGVCIQIAVTTVNGLGVNHNIAILGGTYRIESIDSPSLITICNDGAGITAGTVVDHDDAAGNEIVPIVTIDSNPCSTTAVTEGTLLSCASGIITPLTGLVAGQIPVLQDPVTGEAEYQSVGIPMAVCTVLTICLNLDPNFPAGTSYLITVADTTGIEEGDLIQIGDPAIILYVDSIDGPTTLHATPQPDPVDPISYPEGAVVCLVDCCTILDYKLGEIFGNGTYGDAAIDGFPVDVNVVYPTANSNMCTISFTNISAHNPLGIMFTVDFSWVYRVEGDVGEFAELQHTANVYSGTDPVGVPVMKYSGSKTYGLFAVGNSGAASNNQSVVQSFSSVFAVNPGETAYVRADSELEFIAGDAANVHVIGMYIHASMLGIAPYTP